jgi:hypothetical protein
MTGTFSGVILLRSWSVLWATRAGHILKGGRRKNGRPPNNPRALKPLGCTASFPECLHKKRANYKKPSQTLRSAKLASSLSICERRRNARRQVSAVKVEIARVEVG